MKLIEHHFIQRLYLHSLLINNQIHLHYQNYLNLKLLAMTVINRINDCYQFN